MKLSLKLLALILVVGIITIAIFMKIFPHNSSNVKIKPNPDFYGVTFSKIYSQDMGLDWQETYLAILDDLKVKNIRLPIYWSDIEKSPGVFDYSDYDTMINEGEKRGARFILDVGWRLPRWPECHAPSWTNSEDIKQIQSDTLKMLERTVKRYRNNPSVVYWQVENEPFLNTFGICPPSDEKFLAKEIVLVKSLDDRPIIISGPGELSLWRKEAKLGDVFGTTMYRVVWNKVMGYMRYPIPAWTYPLRAYLAGIAPKDRIVIELQAEPWVPQGKIIYLSSTEANYSFSLDQFKANINYALRTKFEKVYFWGVEWWYWQYKHGNPEYWEFARTLFS